MPAQSQLVRVRVTRRGNIGEGAARGAEMKVSEALETTRGVLAAHVVLDWRPDPAVADHALAEAIVDVEGTSVRAQAAATTMHEAIDEMVDRLVRRLRQLSERRRDRHRWTAVSRYDAPGHGPRRRRTAPYAPRACEDREILRRTSIVREPLTVDEAAYDLDLLDHDFLMFTERATERPAVLRRAPGGYALQRPEGVRGPELAASVRLDPPAPTLTDLQARTRLEAAGERWVYYLNPASGLGRVLYQRYDGHYGLLNQGDEHVW